MSHIHVYADWRGMVRPQRVGIARADVVRGREIVSFEFDDSWLETHVGVVLDPTLAAGAGVQYAAGKSMFGLLEDSAPDRWGRMLMGRREAMLAREEGRSQRVLFPSDYLLEVHDPARLGGLRFKTEPEGAFLADDAQPVPPLSSLRELESASRNLEMAEPDDPHQKAWLDLLLAPGTSLGGARPKATVVDPSGDLWVAKFPGGRDDRDVGGWEAVAYRLASAAGLRTTAFRAEKLTPHGHTFLIKRFDRVGGVRIHFASAMCLLGYSDGDGAESGVSYLDLADFILRDGSSPEADLEELWRRIVFSICLGNTDDHLRNHGFLLGDGGWTLSPVFDVNPDSAGVGLALNITSNDNALDLDLAMAIAPDLRIPAGKCDSIVRQTRESLRDWRRIARGYGIDNLECDSMSLAFRTR